MTLTPTLKFIVIAFAVAFALLSETWVEIDADVEALGMGDAAYSIVSTVLGKLDLLGSALLAYLGLRAPTLEKEPVE